MWQNNWLAFSAEILVELLTFSMINWKWFETVENRYMSRISTRTLCKVSIFYYLFNLGWYSVQLHILSSSWLLARAGVDGHGRYILNRQNPLLLSVMKVICHCWWSLITNLSLLLLLLFFKFFCAFLCLGLFLFGLVICCINRNLYFLAQ